MKILCKTLGPLQSSFLHFVVFDHFGLGALGQVLKQHGQVGGVSAHGRVGELNEI